MKLEGKVAIVTGAAGGIGRGITLCLAEEGADVVIADINMDGANKVAEEVRAFGRKALVVDADVTKEENAKRLVKETLDAFADALARISREALEQPGLVKSAPHSTPVARLDEVKAVRELVLRREVQRE